ncbi:hypothetical protein Tco_1048516 [Tanacetum coccineum]
MVIDEDEVIPENETPELIEEFQNVDKRVPTIFYHERMEATLRDMMRNQFKDDFKYLNKNDIKDMYYLCLNKKVNYRENKLLNSLMTFIRSRAIWERVHDFQLGIESYQININLTAPIKEGKRVMDLVKIVKFFDATMERVLKEVKLKIFETEFLKKVPLLGELDLDIMKAYEREITKRLRHLTASRPGFGYWQWRLATLPFAFRRLRVYSAGEVLYYAFLASQLQSVGLQTKLLRHAGIVAYGPTFDDALCAFNTSMKTNLLSNPSDIAAPKLMKKMANIYFTQVTKNAESTFSLSDRQMDLWRSQREDHTSDLLRALVGKLISGWIGFDRPLRPADMLLHSWDGGLDVFVDLTGSSSLTQTGMTYCMPGQVVIDD